MDSNLPPAVHVLAADLPEIDDYVQRYLAGTPLRVLEIQLKGALGVEIATRFTAAFRPPQFDCGSVPAAELQCSTVEMHGSLGDASWAPAGLAARANDLARPGYETSVAHEYLDVDAVLQSKVKLLAQLVRNSRRLAIYAGAGLSTASGVGDYATKTGADSVVRKEAGVASSGFMSPYSAKPNLGHRAVAALARGGFVWRAVQQNHDGCLQKAGLPQHLVNEIHGSWFDPGNPVVKMTESLRSDLFDDLCEVEELADLVIVLGSSLAGMNADRIVRSCANRACKSRGSDVQLGSVIVSLQRTPHDAESSLRIFATIDKVMGLLVSELSLEVLDVGQTMVPASAEGEDQTSVDCDMFYVPYDSKGTLFKVDSAPKQLLDLRQMSVLTVTIGVDQGQTATIIGKHPEGHYKVSVKRAEGTTSIRYLGKWWVASAVAGDVPHMPLVSVQGPII